VVTLWGMAILLKENLCVYVLAVIAMAVVIIIEAPFFNNYTTAKAYCKRT
jgi:hypothetical protein